MASQCRYQMLLGTSPQGLILETETFQKAWMLVSMQIIAAQARTLAAEPPAVQEFANKSAASAASRDYVKFQAVIKSAASAASLRGGRASG